MMNNKKGFTLMEILLAALIVGVVGIALAALTTAAVREGGVGRTKVMLRQQLSTALRQLRQDIAQSSRVQVTPRLPDDGTFSAIILTQDYPLGPHHTANTITYQFTPGNVVGAGDTESRTGGTICRQVNSGTCGEWLGNVKQIIQDKVHPRAGFVSPSATQLTYGASGDERSSPVLRVRIIVEVPTEPVVNDVIDETFVLPNGFMVSTPQS